MDRDERKRKFNEAIIDMLYPSPPPPESPPTRSEEDSEHVEALMAGSGFDVISDTLDDNENASTSGDEEHDSEPEKLTRAQRKKIRKKKLREEAIRRGKLVGPLLPLSPTNRDGDLAVEEAHAPTVRSNASEDYSGPDEHGVEQACANSKKLKHRRMAKRLAKEKRIASTSANCNQRSASSSAVDPK